MIVKKLLDDKAEQSQIMICETLTNHDISITLWQLSDGPLFF